MDDLFISRLLTESLLQFSVISKLNSGTASELKLRDLLADKSNTMIPYKHYAMF